MLNAVQRLEDGAAEVLRRVEEAGAALLQRLRPSRAPAGAAAASDPSTRLVADVRRRLTAQYTAVLAALLLLAGLLLYFGMREVLLAPVYPLLSHEAGEQSTLWTAQGALPRGCFPFARLPLPYYVACYDTSGNLAGGDQLAAGAAVFLAPNLVRAAVAAPSGDAQDTVSGDTNVGAATIRRYAQVVRDPSSHQALGVVLVGLDIQGEIDDLHTLGVLLLLVAALTLLGSGIGGALLARRSLAPARLALARQQAFIADASHELRTPLTLLRADAEVLLLGRDRLAPDDAPLLDDILAEAEHMAALADNLLTLARLDADAYHMEQDVVDLREVAADLQRRAQALAAERQVRLVIERAEPALVLGDPTRLGEAALTLVDNAIKYNRPGGSVALATYADGREAVLEVRDTGVGVAPEHLNHLGERFYRVDKARSRKLGGAGLGLSIARSIAAAHHGTLTLRSVPDRGTTAALRLPAARATAAEGDHG